MAGRDIILVGASAGGVEALKALVRGLPADLPAAVFVVLHVSPDSRSLLPEILARSGPLPAAHALVESMPSNALAVAGAYHVLPAAGMAPVLVELSRQPKADRGGLTMIDPLDQMPERVRADKVAQEHGQRNGQPSLYSCPECG